MNVQAVIAAIELRNFPIPVSIVAARDRDLRVDDGWVWTVSVTARVPDRENGMPLRVTEQVRLLEASSESPYGERVIIDLVCQLVKNLVTHEVDEAFHYRGERIFDPHARDLPQAAAATKVLDRVTISIELSK